VSFDSVATLTAKGLKIAVFIRGQVVFKGDFY